MLRVVAIDPGETSAFVVAEVESSPVLHRIKAQTHLSTVCMGYERLHAPPTNPDHPNGSFRIPIRGHWKGMEDLRTLATDNPDPHLRGILFHPHSIVVCEDYRVYPSKSRQHIGSPVYTLREIGRIEWLAFRNHLPIVFQSASMAKQRWTNRRIKNHYPELWDSILTAQAGQSGKASKAVHIRDALRHLFTFLEISHLHVFFRKEHAI